MAEDDTTSTLTLLSSMSILKIDCRGFNFAKILLVCFLLIFTHIFIILQPFIFTPLYPHLTSVDFFGWSTNEQTTRATAIVFQLNAGAPFIADRFNLTQAETKHMNDVSKTLFKTKVFSAILCLFLFLQFTLLKNTLNFSSFKQLLKFISFSYITLVLFTSVFIFLFWSISFSILHQILFPQGNWIFSEQSTLIRLFPEVFWQRIIFLIIVLPMFEILCCYVVVRLLSKKPSHK